MKKLSICMLALLASITIIAQNKKGNWIIGTSLGSGYISHNNSESGYSSTPTIYKDESNSFSIAVYPSVGIYLSDDIVLGIEPGIGYYTGKGSSSNTSNPNTSKSKTHYFYPSIGAYGRFYLGKSSTSGMPFVQAGANISFYPGYKSEYESSTGTAYNYTYNNYAPWELYGRVGYEHFINTVIGIQYYVGYSHSSYKYDYTVDYTSGGGTDYTGHYKSNGGSFDFGAGLLIHLDRSKKK